MGAQKCLKERVDRFLGMDRSKDKYRDTGRMTGAQCCMVSLPPGALTLGFAAAALEMTRWGKYLDMDIPPGSCQGVDSEMTASNSSVGEQELGLASVVQHGILDRSPRRDRKPGRG